MYIRFPIYAATEEELTTQSPRFMWLNAYFVMAKMERMLVR